MGGTWLCVLGIGKLKSHLLRRNSLIFLWFSLCLYLHYYSYLFIIDESSHTASRTDSPSFHPLMKSFLLFPSLFNFTVFLSYWNPSPQETSTTTMQSSFKTVPFNPDFYSQASFFFRYTHISFPSSVAQKLWHVKKENHKRTILFLCF